MWCCLLPEKRQRKLASLFTSAMPSDRPNGNANFAFGRSAIQVGERSTLGNLKTRLCIALLAVLVDITRLQVPPRSPKRQSKGCLFFVSRYWLKPLKPLEFLIERNPRGFLRINPMHDMFWALLARYRQLSLRRQREILQ